MTRPLYSLTRCRRPQGCDDALCATEGPTLYEPLVWKGRKLSPTMVVSDLIRPYLGGDPQRVGRTEVVAPPTSIWTPWVDWLRATGDLTGLEDALERLEEVELHALAVGARAMLVNREDQVSAICDCIQARLDELGEEAA